MSSTVTSAARKQTKPASKALPHSHSRKTRISRRRGRPVNGVESDDEIVREARTDSDSEGYQSSIPSDDDSDLESDDDHPAGGSEIVTPNTTQSPPPLDISASVSSTKGAPLKETLLNAENGPFGRATDWAQMVADDKADGDLPVIDFADFNGKALSQPKQTSVPSKSRKHQKHPKKSTNLPLTAAPPVESSPQADHVEPTPEPPVASTSRHSSKERRPSRGHGQTPRQAYQQRLESDPSFVPTVGEFWGHDDRLLDKDLRSLSGWWRGRWQSRGRGRVAFSARGRRAFPPGIPPSARGSDNAEREDDSAVARSTELPPIERTWTHDGFEEMKRREERRQPQKQDSSSQDALLSPPQRGFPFRGRGASGWFGTRGRGGFTRGGALSSPTSSRGGHLTGHPSGRPWYSMKPEKVWTKQHETFLYFDPALKPRPGQGAGFRIKLPGKPEQVIRMKHKSHPPPAQSLTSQTQAEAASASQGSGAAFIVRLPQRAGKQKAVEKEVTTTVVEQPPVVTKETATTVGELSIEDVFKVRPSAVPSHVPLVHTTSLDSSLLPSITDPESQPAPQPIKPSFISSPTQLASPSSQVTAQQQLEQILSPVAEVSSIISAQIEETVLRNPPSANIHAPAPQSSDIPRQPPPALHPLQTSFSPVPPTSPPFGSPYAYGPALPPGVALSHHGFPYEIATGRAVLLQPTPPPSMFTPRPMMQMGPHPSGMSFVPTHMHHPSIPSPDFLVPSHSPPVNGFVDPSTGIPIFTPARHNRRIEIRAPTESSEGKVPRGSHGPSGLRSTSTEHPKPPVSSVPSFFPPPESVPSDQTAVSPSEQSQSQYQAVDPSMVPYNPYQQPYYYPGQYGYPSAYMDMSPQVVNYEMYPADARPPVQSQPIIYY